MTGYELYCDWCVKNNRMPPTREWWNWACRRPRPNNTVVFEPDFDIETERREGWAYD
jgi:hypothetical protein